MSSPQIKPQVISFDAARYLNDDATIAEYMKATVETGDECLLLLALADVASRNQRDHRVTPRPAFFTTKNDSNTAFFRSVKVGR